MLLSKHVASSRWRLFGKRSLKRLHDQWNALNSLFSDNLTEVCEAAHENVVTLLQMCDSLEGKVSSMGPVNDTPSSRSFH